MSTDLPSRGETKCGGISLILTQILWTAAYFLLAIDYDYYDVKTEEDVVKLHKMLSSDEHRLEVEIACALIWISFPLILTALYPMMKIGNIVWDSTPVSSLTYMSEKAFILFIFGICILIPALSLVSVSYDWTFYESTANNDVVPTGYWIQLYIVIFELELIDCLAIADAVFMTAYFSANLYFTHQAATDPNSKAAQLASDLGLNQTALNVVKYVHICCMPTLLIIFIIILFEFAESGFFAPDGYCKFLIVFSFILKVFIGLRFIQLANKKSYDKLVIVYKKTQILTDSSVNYAMETVTIASN
eukprot:233696_1